MSWSSFEFVTVCSDNSNFRNGQKSKKQFVLNSGDILDLKVLQVPDENKINEDDAAKVKRSRNGSGDNKNKSYSVATNGNKPMSMFVM